MDHIMIVLLAVALSVLSWFLVHSAPQVLSMVLPKGLAFGVGAIFFIFAIFSAFASAHVLQNPEGMLESFVTGYVGLWFMLAPSAAMRGSEEDRQFMKRLFLMIGLVMATIIASLYIRDNRGVALLSLALITAGFWVTTNYLQYLDRGKWR